MHPGAQRCPWLSLGRRIPTYTSPSACNNPVRCAFQRVRSTQSLCSQAGSTRCDSSTLYSNALSFHSVEPARSRAVGKKQSAPTNTIRHKTRPDSRKRSDTHASEIIAQTYNQPMRMHTLTRMRLRRQFQKTSQHNNSVATSQKRHDRGKGQARLSVCAQAVYTPS